MKVSGDKDDDDEDVEADSKSFEVKSYMRKRLTRPVFKARPASSLSSLSISAAVFTSIKLTLLIRRPYIPNHNFPYC